ncbi:MAG: acetylxylan esterase [Saprospiraceae bacterium]|nr:acetylxylan esterase [Saprospiraceae bacterium]
MCIKNARKFLVPFLVMLAGIVPAQEDFDVFNYWQHLPDPSETLYRQLLGKANEQLSSRKAEINSLNSNEKKFARQQIVKEKLKRMLLPQWEKTPLNTRIAGAIDRTGYRVEKIIFESFPGYPVSAAIFLPKLQGPMPAILFCSGHSNEGFRSPVYQHMILNYVKKGFIVLAFDPVGQGERNQYFLENGSKRFGPTHEHSYVGNQIFMSGISPAQYFVWDGIRAIDYLVSRPEVDKERIGVTGRSGGGTQTAYLMAVDDRILAAAPECYMTTFEYLLDSKGPQDAEQNILHFLAEGLDLPDLIEVRAPRPTMMVTTTRDIFSIQGARECFLEARSFYKAYGVEQDLLMVEDDAPHQSTKKNREATYRFFQKYLENPGNSIDEDVEIFSQEELWVSDSGQLYKNGYEETLYTVQKKNREKQHIGSLSDANTFSKLIRNISGYSEPTTIKSVFSGANEKSDYSIEKYLIRINDAYQIPLVWLKPHDLLSENTILYIDEAGKSSHEDSTGTIMQLLKAGHQIILADLNGYGEMGKEFDGDALIDGVPLNIWYAGILTGKYPVAFRCEELFAIHRFLENQAVDLAHVFAIGAGSASLDLLTAAVLGVRYSSLILQDCPLTLESLWGEKEYPLNYILSVIPDGGTGWDIPEFLEASGTEVRLLNPYRSQEGTSLEPGSNNLIELVVEPEKEKADELILQWTH